MSDASGNLVFSQTYHYGFLSGKTIEKYGEGWQISNYNKDKIVFIKITGTDQNNTLQSFTLKTIWI